MRGHGHWRVRIPDPEAGPVNKNTLRRVIGAFRPYKRQGLVVGVLIVVTSTLGVANPLLIRTVFDTALFPSRHLPGRPPVILPPNLQRLYWLVGLMVAIPMISGAIGVGQTYLANVIGQRIMQDYRNA